MTTISNRVDAGHGADLNRLVAGAYVGAGGNGLLQKSGNGKRKTENENDKRVPSLFTIELIRSPN